MHFILSICWLRDNFHQRDNLSEKLQSLVQLLDEEQDALVRDIEEGAVG